MVKSLAVEGEEHNVQPRSVDGGGDSYSILPTDLPLPTMNELIENRDQLTESDLDEAISATENFAMELSSQRKSSKLKGLKKKNQGQRKADNNIDTITKPSNPGGETEDISPQDTSSHDLERQDDVIGVTTDTVNDATETPTHIPIDVSVVVKEPSINDMVEDTGNASLVKKSVGIEIDNSPIKKKKKTKKKKNVNRRSRNSSNSTDATDLSKRSTLDSILVGIEEYLQDDNPKNEDIKVNIIQDGPTNLQKSDIRTGNESTQEIFNINVPNKDRVDETLEAKNHINVEKAEGTLSQEGNKNLNFDKETEGSPEHQQEAHGLETGDENTRTSAADYPSQSKAKAVKSKSLTKGESDFNVSASDSPLESREERQIENNIDGIRPPLLVKDEEGRVTGKEEHILEQKDKEDKENKKTVIANHENDKSHNDSTIDGNRIVTPEYKRKANDNETVGPTRRISDDEKNLQHDTDDMSLDVEEEKKENSISPEVKKESAIEKPEAVRDNEVFSIEEESAPKGEKTIENDKEQSKTEDEFSAVKSEGNANPAMISKDSSALKDEAKTSTQENNPKEIVREIIVLDPPGEGTKKGEDVKIVEVVEKNTISEDFEAAKEDEEGRQVELGEAIGAIKDDEITTGAKTINEAIKMKQGETAELSGKKTISEGSETARESGEVAEGGAKVGESQDIEPPKVANGPISERPEDLQVNNEDHGIPKEYVGIPEEDMKAEDVETVEVPEEGLKAEFETAIGSSKEDCKSQGVEIPTEEVETTQKDMEDKRPTNSSKEDEKSKGIEIMQKGDQMTKKDIKPENGEATEPLNEYSEANKVETAEKDVEPRRKTAKKDIEGDLEVEDSNAIDGINVKSGDVETTKEAEIVAEQDKENEKVEAVGPPEKGNKTKCSESAETLRKDGTYTQTETSNEDAEAVAKEDENLEDAKFADTLKEVTKEQDVDGIKISDGDEYEKTDQLFEVGKQEKEVLRDEDRELEKEEKKKENFPLGPMMEDNITEDMCERKVEMEQKEEEDACPLNFNETELIDKRGPNDEENESEDQKTKENPKKPSADDIFKDILDETDEFLEQLKIVDDSELNALLQSLDAKDTVSEQSTQNQDMVPNTIKTSEIRKLNEKEPVYIYTSLAGGGFHMIPRTNRLSTILTANRIPFTYRDLGTDDEARKVWKTFSKGRSLPGVVRGHNDLIGNWEDIEEANEDYKLRELIYDTI